MQILIDFEKHLSAIPEVNSNVGDKVFPLVAKGNRPDTFIVYSPRGGTREITYKGTAGKSVMSIQVDIYSKSFPLNQTIYGGIYEVFNGFSGELNSNTNVGRSEIVSYTNAVGNSDDYFRTTFDIVLTHKGE